MNDELNSVEQKDQSHQQQHETIDFLPPYLVVLFLVFLPPVGLLIILLQKRYHTWLPWVMSLLGIFYLFLFLYMQFAVLPELKSLYIETGQQYPTIITYITILFVLVIVVHFFIVNLLRKKLHVAHMYSKKTVVLIALLLIAQSIIIPYFLIAGTIQPSSEAISYVIEKKTEEINSADDPKNWITYTDTTNGFSIKHPSYWKRDETGFFTGSDYIRIYVEESSINTLVEFLNYNNLGIQREAEITKETLNGVEVVKASVTLYEIQQSGVAIEKEKSYQIFVPLSTMKTLKLSSSVSNKELLDALLQTITLH